MQKMDYAKKSLCFRMDDQKQRFAISGEPGNKLAFLGWEVEDKLDLQTYAERLEHIGVPVQMGDKNLSDMRSGRWEHLNKTECGIYNKK